MRELGKFAKGERPGSQQSNARRHEAYRESAIQEKKREGKWLSKDEYEKRTGKPGRRD
jgi:hypothetical protein